MDKKYLSDENRETILRFLEEDDIIYLSLIDECDIIGLHHTLGQNIRNHFNMWKHYKEGDEHPDDISYQMIIELCEFLRNKKENK